MRAGFFRRLLSAFVDLAIIITLVYLAFLTFGRSLIQNRVDYYDQISENYQEVTNIFNSNKEAIDLEYEQGRKAAGDDQEAKDKVYITYRNKLTALNHHYALDGSVYNRLLLKYNVGLIYFFSLGFALLIAVLVLSFKGDTPGRKLMRVELVGQVTIMNVIIHDLLLKYVLVVVLFLISPYYALVIIPAYFIIDLFLILLTKDKTTIRDSLSKIILNYKPKLNKKNKYI